MEKIFVNFLKETNTYEAFCRNLYDCSITTRTFKEYTQLLGGYPDSFITCAFGWSATSEGRGFWEKLNDKW